MTPAAGTHALVDGLFRSESARLIAGLARRTGLARLDLVEDAVHDAMVAALRQWPVRGVPRDPAGWLATTAHRRALDRLRALRVRDRKSDSEPIEDLAGPDFGLGPPELQEARDDQLRMLLACCDPRLPLESRVALALKTLCGLSVREIARAFLASESAIEQRITRARRSIAAERIELRYPPLAQLPLRTRDAGEVLYAMFAEGHAATSGAELVRVELVREAMRLGELMLDLDPAVHPPIHALLALFCLHASRLPARVDGAGEPLTLDEQDRSLWDRALLARGFAHLERAASGAIQTRWHVEAAIAAAHSVAPDAERTDWPGILVLYDRLCARWPTPITRLSRAVALGRAESPLAGLRALAALSAVGELATHHLLPAARADLLVKLGDPPSAAAAWREAFRLAPTAPERRFFVRRLLQLGFEP